MFNLEFKIALFEVCSSKISTRIDTLQREIKLSQESANADGKSSMGDKYETSHAMAHLEKEKLGTQLNESIQQQKVIAQAPYRKEHKKAQLGSLIESTQGLFLIGASLGQINFQEHSIFCISPVSPLGKLLLEKTVNENYTLNNKVFSIKTII